jgi:hypothetical protein
MARGARAREREPWMRGVRALGRALRAESYRTLRLVLHRNPLDLDRLHAFLLGQPSRLSRLALQLELLAQLNFSPPRVGHALAEAIARGFALAIVRGAQLGNRTGLVLIQLLQLSVQLALLREKHDGHVFENSKT